jgi:4-diphosphocytidyl-2-C-methyl-D-erythritol kinase
MRLHALAKLNLHLRVGALRNDGFHPLHTWMVTIGLFDTLTFDDAPPADIQAGTVLVCDDPDLKCDETNLIVRAVDAMRDASIPQKHVKVHLQKRIPMGAGLGGGSSDAARTILGLNRFWNLNRSIDDLSRIAQQLGSDVPFFLHGPSSVCTGRGEIVQPIAPPKLARWATLILPKIAMPTAIVYKTFDALGLGKAQARLDQPERPAMSGVERQEMISLSSLSSEHLLPRLVNDLELPAFHLSPELARMKSELQEALGRTVRMSGSGSTLFTLYDDAEAAQRAADIVTRRGIRSIVVETGVAPNDDL